MSPQIEIPLQPPNPQNYFLLNYLGKKVFISIKYIYNLLL